jgi:uncharacterized Zn finger protein (UPF0148 family)
MSDQEKAQKATEAKMYICKTCTHEYASGTKFCPQCGEKTPEQIAAESLVEQTKHYVNEAAEELWSATKEAGEAAYKNGKHLADQDSAKKIAGGAALGAAAGLLLPVGVAASAVVGAGIVGYRHVTKKKQDEENKKKP